MPKPAEAESVVGLRHKSTRIKYYEQENKIAGSSTGH